MKKVPEEAPECPRKGRRTGFWDRDSERAASL